MNTAHRVCASYALIAMVSLARVVLAEEVPPQPPELTRTYEGVLFSDMNHGYVFGKTAPTAVLATDNGGATWRLVLDLLYRPPTPPSVLPELGQNIESVYFLDAQRFWILERSGKLYRSADSGRNLEVLTPTYVDPRRGERTSLCGQLFFVSPPEGWTVCTTTLKTTDGGATWTRVLGPRLEGPVHEIWMFDSKEGIGLGDEHVFRTTDGGSTWAAVFNSSPLEQVSCTKAHFCAGLVWLHGPLLVSRDRGQTWQDTHIPLQLPDRDEISAIQALSPSSALAVGIDRGRSFEREVAPYVGTGTPPPPGPEPRAIILKLDGSTWTRITHDDPQRLTGLSFVDAQHGWLITNGDNIIYKTNDGGQTLQFVSDYFRQIAALTPTEPPLPPGPTPTPGP